MILSLVGYFSFEECGEDVIPHPTIGLIVGETYTFVQKDVSNWMHPMGFAYYPDGAHDDKMELEPSVTPYASVCNATNECPSPRYYIDDTYQGENGTANFGLDVYEPLFARSIAEWSSLGTFSFQLNFNDSMFTDDIFYFCHVSLCVSEVFSFCDHRS